MIRVLHVLDSMNRGGIETTLMNIFRRIDRNKVVFDFLVTTDKKCDYDDEIYELGGKIYNITPRKKNYFQNIKDLNVFFKLHKEYKIIHMHVGSLSYIMPLKVAKKYKVPVRIIHSRNTQEGGRKIHKYIHSINKLFIKNIATNYFSCSDLAGKWLYTKKILKNENYKMINNGILTEKFIYSEKKRKEIRNELNCENKTALVNVGRLHPQKNHEFLLEIFKEYNKINKNSVLYLIGEGSLRKNIEEKIKILNLEDKVVLLGKRDNIHELLQGMDIFVMPSLYEGLPGSVVEAQGAGLPCLISNTITKDVKITDLVTFEDINISSKEWANQIKNILKNFKRRNTQKELLEAGFDMGQVAKILEKFYKESV